MMRKRIKTAISMSKTAFSRIPLNKNKWISVNPTLNCSVTEAN